MATDEAPRRVVTHWDKTWRRQRGSAFGSAFGTAHLHLRRRGGAGPEGRAISVMDTCLRRHACFADLVGFMAGRAQRYA